MTLLAHRTVLALAVLVACEDRDPLDSATNNTAVSGGPGGGSNNMTGGTDSDTTDGTITGGPLTDGTATALPTSITGEPEATTTDGTGATAPTTTPGTITEEWPDPTEAGPANAMEKFGAPCDVDADCQAILGPDAKCLKDILGIYGLPGGYCTLLCDLPPGIAYAENDALCGQGVTCMGADGYFESCVVECTDNSQCPREGYICRTMPQIGEPDDPKFCLMTDDNML